MYRLAAHRATMVMHGASAPVQLRRLSAAAAAAVRGEGAAARMKAHPCLSLKGAVSPTLNKGCVARCALGHPSMTA